MPQFTLPRLRLKPGPGPSAFAAVSPKGNERSTPPRSPARRSCCCCLPPRRFWLAATELAPLWSQGGVEEERFLRLHRRGGRPAAHQTMILAMTRKRRTMIPDGARWTRYRQAGGLHRRAGRSNEDSSLLDGMTGDRFTDHARCALGHLLSKVSTYFVEGYSRRRWWQERRWSRVDRGAVCFSTFPRPSVHTSKWYHVAALDATFHADKWPPCWKNHEGGNRSC